MTLRDDQLHVYDILTNICLKIITGLSVNVAFWFILCRVLFYTDDQTRIISLSVVDAILGGTMYKIVGHYFPAIRAAVGKQSPKTKIEQKAKPSQKATD